MAASRVSAEIEPQPGEARAAAAALQERGFQIRQLRETVSVDAPQALWEQVFGVAFEDRPRPSVKGVDTGETYPRAKPETTQVPADLRELVKAVIFVEPPEFF